MAPHPWEAEKAKMTSLQKHVVYISIGVSYGQS